MTICPHHAGKAFFVNHNMKNKVIKLLDLFMQMEQNLNISNELPCLLIFFNLADMILKVTQQSASISESSNQSAVCLSLFSFSDLRFLVRVNK